jgi:hypothetical protein
LFSEEECVEPYVKVVLFREEECVEHYVKVVLFREEECVEHYEKLCYIVFKQQATTETIQHCYRPLVRECNDVQKQGMYHELKRHL